MYYYKIGFEIIEFVNIGSYSDYFFNFHTQNIIVFIYNCLFFFTGQNRKIQQKNIFFFNIFKVFREKTMNWNDFKINTTKKNKCHVMFNFRKYSKYG